jgi:hypothetical protein
LEELMDAKAQSWLAAVESQESSMAQQKKSAAKDIGEERPRIGGIGGRKTNARGSPANGGSILGSTL